MQDDSRLLERIDRLEAQLGALRAERRHGRVARRRWLMGAAFVAVLGAAVASASPVSPFPCPGGDLYCFAAGGAALAAEVNSNFAKLATDIATNASDVVALGTEVDGKLDTSGGTVSGNLTVTGTLQVGSEVLAWKKMPISRSSDVISFTDAGGVVRTFDLVALTPDSSSCTSIGLTMWAVNASNTIRAEYFCNGMVWTPIGPVDFNIEGSPSTACTLLHEEDDAPDRIHYFATDQAGSGFGGDWSFELRALDDDGSGNLTPLANNDGFVILCM